MKNTKSASFQYSHVHYVYNEDGIQVHKEDYKPAEKKKLNIKEYPKPDHQK